MASSTEYTAGVFHTRSTERLVMKIAQKSILRSIFSLKGNFTPGIAAPTRVFDGIEVAPFWNACAAAVSISADFELNWAFRSRPAEQRDQLGVTERRTCLISSTC